MILCGTGHRPEKIGGYNPTVYAKLVKLAEKHLLLLKPERVISGMALGWDQALADATNNLKLPLIVAIPFQGQESVWPEASRDKYFSILDKATDVVYVSEPGYSVEKMQTRNRWMVDQSDLILAIWNGSKGGTYNCIQYAKKQHKEIINVWEEFREMLKKV
jgi:uncharacterized phage-like protein YoqJ